MKLINRIKSKLNYLIAKQLKPEIIGGWQNSNGKLNRNTGVSNTTHISQQLENLYIGDNVFIGHFNYIDGYNAKLTISDGVQITNYVQILTHSTHNAIRFNVGKIEDKTLLDKLNAVGEVSIGENTYIGPHSVIMPGTKIGKACIVSAYSYVKGEFPDFSVIRGQPAKTIGSTKNIDKININKYIQLESYYNDENN